MTRALRSPVDELDDLANENIAPITSILLRMARAIVEKNPTASARAGGDLARVVARSGALADLFGRRRLLLEADAAVGRRIYTDNEEVPMVSVVSFEEALEDLTRRDPRLAQSAETVAEIYSKEHVFAAARAANLAVTRRVQKFMVDARRARRPMPSIIDLLTDMEDWSRSYAETVYRTNLNTAYTAGRFRQASDPTIKQFLPAFEFMTANDAVVRGRSPNDSENHLAMHGYIAPTDARVWSELSPPLGYNCRCTLRLVSKYELERKNLYQDGAVVTTPPPSGVKPHPNFGRGRPDHRIYFKVGV